MSWPVAHGPGEGEVVLVVLHGSHIVTQVEVRVAQLTVDGAGNTQKI